MTSSARLVSRVLPLALIFGVGLAGAAGGRGIAAPSVSAKIDARVFAGKATGESAEFLVVLGDRADLSAAAAIGDRAARRSFVYEVLRAHAESTQARLRERLRATGVRFRTHYLVSMIEVEGSRALAEELAANADVLRIERNGPARLEQPRASEPKRAATAAAGIEPNILKVRAPELWARGFTGQGIVIGVADTGFEWDHPALKNQYRGWDGSRVSHDYNWHDAIHDAAPENRCGSDSPAPCDDFGHGTAVAGLAVGDDGAGDRIGVAPGARLVGCRNMDGGTGTPARYTECFEWMLAPTDGRGENPRPDLGADVINNSWTCPVSEGCTDPSILRDVVENVRMAGVAVIVAAGNNGIGCGNIVEAPAIFDASITIGATDINDQATSFSSSGPVTIDGSNRLKPDLSAPGALLRTAAQPASYQDGVTGTSAAAPHVTGGIALLWSALPALAGDVDRTELALEAGAVPLTLPPRYNSGLDQCDGGAVPNPIFGWGRLDVERAYELSTTPAQGPSPCVADATTLCLGGGRLTQYPLPTAGSGPGYLTAGPDGNLWFAHEAGTIARISTSGVVTEFHLLEGGWPTSIAAGPDGNLWFTESLAGIVGRMTTAGLITEFRISGTSPLNIAAGPDGNLWFVAIDEASESFRIGRITTAGTVSIFAIPSDSYPSGIAAGSDGNVWFTDLSGSVRRMTTEGALTGTFRVPTGGRRSSPAGIVAGPDGNLWFTDSGSNGIGRITVLGVITTFPIPSGGSPWGLSAGPDGNLWFTESMASRVGRITTSGLITEVSVPAADGLYYPASIAAGSDGNIWFTEWSGKSVGRITTRGPSACVADAKTLCLGDGRFQVRADWQVLPQGTAGHGTAFPLVGNTGAFWFFDPESIEVVVKALDGCALNGHAWVFAAGLTNVGVTMTVTDTTTGANRAYTNAPGTAFQPVQDTTAFSTCP